MIGALRHAQNSWRPANVPANPDPLSYLDYGHPDDPLHYQMLALRPGTRLYEVKMRFLLQARRHHPEVGGDPEHFLRVCLAYQDVLKDYGLETIDGTIRNLGNFQVCGATADEYLRLRAAINEEIPYSTLLNHLQEHEAIEAKLTDAKRELLESGKIADPSLLPEQPDYKPNTYFPDTTKKSFFSAFFPPEDPQAGAKAAALEASATDDPIAGVIEASPQSASAAASSPPVAAERIAHPDHDAPQTSRPNSAIDSTSTPLRQDTSTELQQIPPLTSSGIVVPRDSNVVEQVHKVEIQEIVGENGRIDEDLLAQVVLTREELAVYERKYDVEYRKDIAGEAARVATTMMKNTSEVKQAKFYAITAIAIWGMLFTTAYGAYESLQRKRGMAKAQGGNVREEHMAAGMQLPWWGNDVEYEKQVKRLYVEEWMRARRTARRVQTYQDGVQREAMDASDREKDDLEVFSVTPERLKKMREHALAQNGKY